MLAALTILAAPAPTQHSYTPREITNAQRRDEVEFAVGDLTAAPGLEIVSGGAGAAVRLHYRDPTSAAEARWISVPLLTDFAPSERLEMADVDGDGRRDVLVTGIDPGTGLRSGGVLFNDTHASTALPDFTWVRWPGSSDLGRLGGVVDLDGDGRRDLVFMPQAFLVTLQPTAVFQIGPRTFSAQRPLGFPLASGGAAADLDQDGDGDLMLVRMGNLELHRNDGGSFQLAYQAPLAGGYGSVEAADLDADGDLDVIAQAPNGRLVLEAVGPWQYAEAQRSDVPLFGYGELDLVDVAGGPLPDLVGRPDTATHWAGWRPRLLERTGPLSFRDGSSPLPGLDGTSFTAGRLADVDRDGLVDFVGYASSRAGLSVRYGRNDAQLGFHFAGSGDAIPVIPGPVRIGAMVPLDVDGDGDLDLVSTNRGQLWVTEQQARESFVHGAPHRIGLGAPRQAVAVGRFGAPRTEGVATVRIDGALAVFPAPHAPASTGTETIDVGGAFESAARTLVALDLDQDGDDDLVGIARGGGTLLLARQTSPGVFTPPAQTVPALAGHRLTRLVAGDWNGDGADDVAFCEVHPSGAWSVRAAVQTQGALAPSVESIPLGSEPTRVRAAPLPPVLHEDRLWIGAGGSITAWSFDPAGAPVRSAPLIRSQSFLDFDAALESARGPAALVIHTVWSDGVTTFTEDPLGGFAPLCTTPIPLAARPELTTVDMDRDGDLDVLLADELNGAAVWLSSNLLPERSAAFCAQPTPHSLGVAAELRATALAPTSAQGASDVQLHAFSLPPGATGLLLVARARTDRPAAGGTLCLGGTIGRLDRPAEIFVAPPSGAVGRRVDTSGLPFGDTTAAGQAHETWYFQAWFRDGPNPGLTNAVAVTL